MRITIEIDDVRVLDQGFPKESEVPGAGAEEEKEYSVGASLVGGRKLVKIAPGEYRWFDRAVFMQGEIPTNEDLQMFWDAIELPAALDRFITTEDLRLEFLVSGSVSGPLAAYVVEIPNIAGDAAFDAALTERFPDGYTQAQYSVFIEEYVRAYEARLKGGDPV